jgi:hypothetical protein
MMMAQPSQSLASYLQTEQRRWRMSWNVEGSTGRVRAALVCTALMHSTACAAYRGGGRRQATANLIPQR